MTDLAVTSGLNIAQKTLDSLAANVANVSTTGYKAGNYSFLATLASSTNAVLSDPSSGLIQQFTQGNITSTGNPLNAAINGQGFFRLTNSNGQVSYTRNGEFVLGSTGNLQSVNGNNVMGYNSDGNGKILPALTSITLDQSPLPPAATKNVKMAVNLAGSQTPITTPFDSKNPATYTKSETAAIYDPSGISHSLQTYFVASGTNKYDLYFGFDKSSATPTSGSPTSLQFNADGTQVAGNPTSLTFNLPTNVGGTNFPVSLDISKLTQFGTAYQASSVTQDGYATGNFSNFDIGQDGKISAYYGNGQSAVVAQLALANFVNPQGLAQTNNGLYLESAASGQPTIGAPGTGALGVLQSKSLEASNVDIAAAMVDMITAQRNYQANAQAIKINDQIMQDLVTLR